MRLTFLGKETQGGGSPTLFATDRETYVVQGWKVPGQQHSVEIPTRLLAHLQPGTCLGVELHDTGRGSVILSGNPVTDTEALAQMDIPGHETCVEVAVAKNGAPMELLAGKAISRVRVVTVPHVDYTKWGLTVAEHNIAAGEDIRWLPRHLVDPESLTTDDYWLFDDDRVVFTVVAPDGRFVGGATTTDPAIVRRCREIRDRVWPVAVPHSRYVFSEY